MDKHTLTSSWHEIKSKIQKAWGRLTDEDLKNVEHNWNELPSKLQKTYGYTQDEAREEVEDFKAQYMNSPDYKPVKETATPAAEMKDHKEDNF